MASSVIAAGLGMAAIGFAGRYIMRNMPNVAKTFTEGMRAFPSSDGTSFYKGGFESKMTRREAALILGISPSSSKPRIKIAHKKIMSLNHPDRGGSPFIASKINEAKDLLERNSTSQSSAYGEK